MMIPAQIGRQIQGLLWKDGGPVVGVWQEQRRFDELDLQHL